MGTSPAAKTVTAVMPSRWRNTSRWPLTLLGEFQSRPLVCTMVRFGHLFTMSSNVVLDCPRQLRPQFASRSTALREYRLFAPHKVLDPREGPGLWVRNSWLGSSTAVSNCTTTAAFASPPRHRVPRPPRVHHAGRH